MAGPARGRPPPAHAAPTGCLRCHRSVARAIAVSLFLPNPSRRLRRSKLSSRSVLVYFSISSEPLSSQFIEYAILHGAIPAIARLVGDGLRRGTPQPCVRQTDL